MHHQTLVRVLSVVHVPPLKRAALKIPVVTKDTTCRLTLKTLNFVNTAYSRVPSNSQNK
jgi:hypothetical protein